MYEKHFLAPFCKVLTPESPARDFALSINLAKLENI
jgi:hypothetical protein